MTTKNIKQRSLQTMILLIAVTMTLSSVAMVSQQPQAFAAIGFDDPIILDSDGDVGIYSSIAIGTDGFPVISYRDKSSNDDLKFIHCTSMDCTSIDTPLTLDTEGPSGRDTSIAIGTDGFPVISYDFDFGLKFVHCTSIDCTSADTPLKLDNGFVGEESSIAIGTDGFPVISYYDDINSAVKFVHCTSIDCTSADAPFTLDNDGFVGFFDTSIAIGTDGFPVISYGDDGPNELRFTHCTSIDCNSADAPLTLDEDEGGNHSSLEIGTDGFPVISYRGGDGLEFVHCTSIDCTGADAPLTLDSEGNVGIATSLEIGTDGFPVIIYGDVTNSALKFVHCTSIDCTGADAPLTLDNAAGVGFKSLTIGTDGFPVISYYDFANGDLKLVHCTGIDCLTDGTPPVITLIGDNPIQLIENEMYVEQGSTATDNDPAFDPNSVIIDDSAVDTNTAGTYEVTYNVSDAAGNAADQVTRTVNVITATEATNDLISDIEGLGLPNGVENSLIAPLKGIEKKLNDGNSNNDGAVCGKLNAFLDKVDSQETAGNLDAADADDLRAAAIRILDALGC